METLANIWLKFQNSGSVLYGPFLLSALTLSIFALIYRLKSIKAAFRTLLDRRVFFSRSAGNDFVIVFFHYIFVKGPEFAFYGLLSNWIFKFVDASLFVGKVFDFPLAIHGPWDPQIHAAAVAVLTLMGYDLGTYVAHVLLHKVPWLWNFHGIHHSAEQLTFLTAHRQHPLEPFFLRLFRAAFAASIMATAYFIFPMAGTWMTASYLATISFGYMLTINLHHSHIPIRYPKFLRMFLISPNVHHIHHSRALKHRDKNFGVIFSFWDRLFGTYWDEATEISELEFGLDPKEDPFQGSLLKMYLLPLFIPLNSIALALTGFFKIQKPKSLSYRCLSLSVLLLAMTHTENITADDKTNSFQIIDRHCHEFSKNGAGIAKFEKSRDVSNAKPFACRREQDKFHCFSNTHKKSFIFNLASENRQILSLSSKTAQAHAIITIDKTKNSFEVVVKKSGISGSLIEERCVGDASINEAL